MGEVYLAEDTQLDRNVAIKFLPKHVSANDEMRNRFKVEAKAAAALNHPNIATIYNIEAVDGEIFIVMEYIDGKDLSELIENVGAKHSWQTTGIKENDLARNASPLHRLMPIAEILDISLQISKGLQVAHENGVVHRDIKSANIMLTARGEVKIMDFGLAKVPGGPQLTKGQSTLGTAAYMSPEQTSGEAVDQRSDIFSFGVLLYEMLTGQRPFKGEYEQAVAYSILNIEPEPVTALRSGIPMALERIVNKCLQKEPSSRYQHVEEMTVDLTAVKKQIETGETKKHPDESASLKRKSFYRHGGLISFLILVVFFGYYFWPEQRVPINSIAVLPLNNLSGDSTQVYFVDGMTEILITELSKIEALRVISRASVMRYKNTGKSMPEIAQELQVGALVDGSLLRIGNQVRFTVQLIEAETDHHLWANDYERDFRDVLTLQKEMARTIAREINIQLTPRDDARIGEEQPVDPVAFDLYLRGSGILKDELAGSTEQAIKYLEQSVAIDPNFVPAYSYLVEACFTEAGNSLSVAEAELKARRAASKALQLNEKLAEAHVAMGLVLEFFELDWAGAEQSFRRAIQLNPRSEYARIEYGWLLLRLGRFDEALAEFEMHHTLEDPFSITPYSGLAAHYYYTRQCDLSIKWSRKGQELDSTANAFYGFLGAAYLEKGEYDLAITFAEKYLRFGRWSPRGVAGYIYAVAGEREKALKLLDSLQVHWQQGAKSSIAKQLADIYTGLGQKEKALTWLERAYELRNYLYLHDVKVHPMFDSLRDEPRFKALLKKMKLE